MLDMVEIGEQVRKARQEKNMTMSELAERARMSRNRVHMLETGKAPDLGFMRLQRICNAVGLDFRMTTLSANNRPTFEDLQQEAEQEARDDTPGLG